MCLGVQPHIPLGRLMAGLLVWAINEADFVSPSMHSGGRALSVFPLKREPSIVRGQGMHSAHLIPMPQKHMAGLTVWVQSAGTGLCTAS